MMYMKDDRADIVHLSGSIPVDMSSRVMHFGRSDKEAHIFGK